MRFTVLSIYICCLGMALVSTLGSDNKDMARTFNKYHQLKMIRRMQRSYSSPGNSDESHQKGSYSSFGNCDESHQKDSHSEECANGCDKHTLRNIVKSNSIPTEITIVSLTDAGPFIVQNGNGSPTGFDVDLMKYIGCLLHIKFTYIYTQFINLAPTVQNNPNTISIGFQTDSVTREQSVNFSQYIRYSFGFIVKSDYTGTINGLAGLCGKTVVSIANSTPQIDITQQNTLCGVNNQITFIGVSNITDIINTVKSGGATVGVFIDLIVAYYASHSKGQLKVVGSVYHPATGGILVNKGNPALSCLLVDAINYLIRDGTYERLLNDYSLTYATNGVCPSRVNLNGTTCLPACVPDNSFC